MSYYILDEDKNPVESDIHTWARTYEDFSKRRVARTEEGDTYVSTVFLGLDHSFDYSHGHIPILFETMIFGGEHDLYQERYATWAEAEAGHKTACQLAFGHE